MSDKQQVRDAGIRSAIIVDDGYDEIPEVAELRNEGAWDSFFDDAEGEEAERIQTLFPSYSPEDRDELRSNQEFIDALWHGRANIRDLLGGLFDSYEQKILNNRPFLKAAEATLAALEIPYTKCGRDFVEAAVKADLIVIDLFLGIQQGYQDRKFTVRRLREVIKRRENHPLPSIILMSQVLGIDGLAKDFRQDMKLHASAFRHISKDDLPKPGRTEGLILTLAMQRLDSQALATFVGTWEAKAIEAVHSVADTLRKIDIDDLQHIRSMLLRFEGLNTSSYILDVFDRVLQYEIESHGAVLEAAIPLDDMADDPAPLMISNDRDTYDVIERTLFVNRVRWYHATGAVWPVAFGDILGPRAGVPVRRSGFFSGREDLVYFVASPECDLIRKDGLTTALLVAGSLKGIGMTNPDLAVSERTTPVLSLDGDQRFQVEWDFGNLRAINLKEARGLLHPHRGDTSIVARLRQVSALSLRQKLLSNVGRVADLAPLPRSLRFRANLFFPLQKGGAQPIAMPGDVKITGNVLIPRRAKFAATIVDSKCEAELTSVLLGLDLTNVASKSHRKFKTLKEQTRIRQIFRSGLQGITPPLKGIGDAGLLKIGELQPESDAKKPKVDNVATILQGDDIGGKLGDIIPQSGLIVQIYIEEGD